MQKVEMELGGKVLSLETGRLALEADGSVIVRYGDTMVLATATASKQIRKGIDFFPLLIDYEEKMYAAGKIPGGFFKREGRPTEKAILTSRLIDRPLRPLFEDGVRNDVQVVITPLSFDQENTPDILAMIGASAALSISRIPFAGPAAGIRIGRINGEFIVYPTIEQMTQSDLDLIVAGTKDAVMMIEAGVEELPEETIVEGVKFAHEQIKKIVKLQEDLAAQVGTKKVEFTVYAPEQKLVDLVKKEADGKFEKALKITDKDKQKEEITAIEDEIKEKLKSNEDPEAQKLCTENEADFKYIVKNISKKIVRKMITEEGIRPDGRKTEEIRTITCETSPIPRTHGSAVFTRGQTQVLSIATLGAAGDGQRIEGLEAETKKRYMHHYNFPAFSVGEVRPQRGPGRREIGHGALAERALMPVLPSEDDFPYAIRLVSEVLASNGSTSMASTCGSTLALMDAGVPIKSPVAGIAMGLIKEDDKVAILSDIQGLEDFLGDMDFKVTGTRKGVTAIQLDMKIKGIDFDVISKGLAQAKNGRMFILDKMESSIKEPRTELSPFAPRVVSMKIDQEKIGTVIGPGGKMIRGMIEEFGVQIDINDDGRVLITSPDVDALNAVQAKIKGLTAEIELGKVYEGTVTRIMNFGAFVEVLPGKEGLVHISQLAKERVNKVEDVVKVGDKIKVKASEKDDMGRYNFSKKAVDE